VLAGIGRFTHIMRAEIRMTLERASKIGLVFVALICIAASCETQRSAGTVHGVTRVEPNCAFSDPVFMTSWRICDLAAEYYIMHREWPLTKGQLQEQLAKMLEAAKADMSANQMLDSSEFFGQFALLDLHKSGKDLVMHYRFNVEDKTVERTVTLSPGQTADEIVQAAHY